MFGIIMTIITTPTVGMEFDSADEAWEFWLGYGKEIGFGVRRQYFNRMKVNEECKSS
jgi:hypothetical protein